MKRMTLAQADALNRKVDRRGRAHTRTRFSGNRTNCLAQIRKIFIYLTGRRGGYEYLAQKLREKFPEAHKPREPWTEGPLEWFFDPDKVWAILMEDEKLAETIKWRRIDSYEELCFKANEYADDYNL